MGDPSTLTSLALGGGRRTSQVSILRERSDYRVSFLHPEKPPKQVVTGFWDKKLRKHRKRVQTFSWLDWLAWLFPCTTWIRTYNVKQWLFWDLIAGLSVGFMVIPQGMSYANVANLPAIFGLYGAFVPTLMYCVFGTCGQLAVGPVAVTSLLLGTGLQKLFGGKLNSTPNTPADPCLQEDYNHAAVQVAFLAGLMYTAIGFLGLGWIVNFLSRAVISGFMTAAATIILLSQVKFILGVSVPKVDPVHQQLANLIDAVKVPGAFSWREFVMGMTFIFFLLFLRWAGRRKIRGVRLLLVGAMGPILVTIIGTASMNIFKWYEVHPIVTATTVSAAKNTTSTTFTLATYCAVLANSTNVTATAATLTSLYAPSQCSSTSLSSSVGSNLCAVTMFSCINGNQSCFQKASSLTSTVKCLGNVTGCVTTASSCLSVSSCSIKLAKATKTTTPLIKPVGAIPSGMPKFTAGWYFPMYDFGQQFVLAVIICFVDICESISIAKAMALKKHYEIDGTKELQGLGISNIMGSLFNCYTTTGSFSRTAVNYSVGARTPLSSLFTGIVIMFTLLFLTPLFTNMPQNVQGAIIIAAVVGIMDFHEAWFLFKVSKVDFVVWLVAWLCTMFLGVESGIGISVGSSILLVVMHTAFPSIRMLGCLPNTSMYRDMKQYPEAKPIPGMLILRLDAPIYFANIPHLKEWFRRRLRKCSDRRIPVEFVVLDLSAVSAVDASAIHFFLDLVEILKRQRVALHLVNPRWQVLNVLIEGAVMGVLDENAVHVVIHDAVLFCQDLGSPRMSPEINPDSFISPPVNAVDATITTNTATTSNRGENGTPEDSTTTRYSLGGGVSGELPELHISSSPTTAAAAALAGGGLSQPLQQGIGKEVVKAGGGTMRPSVSFGETSHVELHPPSTQEEEELPRSSSEDSLDNEGGLPYLH